MEGKELILDSISRANMERFADFMARMIEKYGKEILSEIEEDISENEKIDNP